MSSSPTVPLEVFTIPLQATPQTLGIQLAGVQYQLTVRWNNIAQCWMIDIADVNGNPLVNGIPMITGADLLEQYGYLNFGGKLIAQTVNEPNAVPTFTNLGVTAFLYFLPNAN